MGSSVESCGPDGLSFLHGRLPPRFELRVVTMAPGQLWAYDQAEWRDALVVVERGELVLECRAGSRRCFGRGDVLCLEGLPLRALHNRGPEPVVLAVVSRRGAGAACRDGMER
jgi:quercetin dioxygenase-like cupin family protein